LVVTTDLHDVSFVMPPSGSVTFEGVTIERVDFHGLKFESFNSSASRFVDCDFSRTSFRLAGGFSGRPRSTFIGCDFDRASLHAMFSLKNTRFERCRFGRARVSTWRSECAEFVECSFSGRVRGCQFSGRPIGLWSQYSDRDVNEFRDNDFSAAQLEGTSFGYGIDIAAQRWPTDGGYVRFDRPAERIARARAAIATWPPGRERKQGLRILENLASHGHLEQVEVIVGPDWFHTFDEDKTGKLVRDLIRSPLSEEG
jgi:hypothetical protein